ncbi:hypothetical protein D3C86_1890280 [compost metagenome]
MLNRISKRNQLHFAQASEVILHNGQPNVRIDRCIAMTRKMLHHRNNLHLLQAIHHRNAEGADEGSICAKRTVANDRIFRIAIDV